MLQVTPIDFNGLLTGDFLVLQKHNCQSAHTAVTAAQMLGKTQILNTLWGETRALTDTDMTELATLRVCVATKEAHGDSEDDYLLLANNFSQFSAPDIWPRRTASGAAQQINITKAEPGSEIAWTSQSTCLVDYYLPQIDVNSTYEQVDMYHTAVYGLNGSNIERWTDYEYDNGTLLTMNRTRDYEYISLHRNTSAGIWTLCYRLPGGVWTRIEETGSVPTTTVTVDIIPKPTFTPAVGIAGSITVISFAGVIDGDIIVIQVTSGTQYTDTNSQLSS